MEDETSPTPARCDIPERSNFSVRCGLYTIATEAALSADGCCVEFVLSSAAACAALVPCGPAGV